jgi:chemosensory pili system protein ChpA (sensor histidine kinase/response regulator)
MKPDGREVEIAQALEALLAAQSSSGSAFNAEAIWALGSSLGHLQAKLERLEGHQEATVPGDEQELIDQLTAIAAQMKTEQAAMPPPAVAEEEEPEDQPAGPDITDEWSALDQDIIAIFMEEAREVLARCDSLLHEWHDGLDGFDIVQNLQREIHTFKGGARMAGLEALGNLSHAMESLLERIAGRELPLSKPAVRALENGCDRLNDWLDAIARGERPDDAAETLAFFEDQAKMLDGVPAGLASPLESEPANFDIPAPEMEAAAKAGAEEPEVEAVTPEPEARDIEAIPEETETPVERAGDGAAQSHMRVEAELLDSLVNSASEINILRSRLERQISNIRSNLGEFDATLGRLREQFRKLEIETETQIRSRYQDTGEEGTEGFDPLELDRFSSMQQLSRGLSESVADLLNLQELLDDSARNSETLLTQQSRFSTELQEGLMQTRMVPFGSIAPRLRRLVRTATRETGKNCRLKLQMAGGSDQLDRNVLERITAPLEHMLRNAIAHGIEKPSERKKAGKPAEGEISITVESEATEFVLRIEDDGAGINLDAIRQRAASQGLIAADADPPAHQLFEFMLQSGFSTSTTVTGLAGRGIGLDVVSSEIKQIGGSLEIASQEGLGTSFTIRIPFTLAVMQAIGVVAGENRYLIPLASVAGVARMLPAEYLELAGHEEPVYQFAGKPYPLLDLEPLLGEPSHPIGNDKVSLLIVRTGNQRAAFRIPQLTGHREIVIKPVGPQISSVPGILGGTVTGDGQVVVILDPGPLIRHALLHGARVEPAVPVVDHQARPNLAMVVDDSITMRKVTSRVLQEQGFEVITARDGVDATEQLQERVPDLLLLDIEMPRMDGYGVAEFVRADARLRHIPIMMITSRSGQKHRDRAKQAGANAYLTKPYKEAELLAEVGRLLDKESEAHGP